MLQIVQSIVDIVNTRVSSYRVYFRETENTMCILHILMSCNFFFHLVIHLNCAFIKDFVTMGKISLKEWGKLVMVLCLKKSGLL